MEAVSSFSQLAPPPGRDAPGSRRDVEGAGRSVCAAPGLSLRWVLGCQSLGLGAGIAFCICFPRDGTAWAYSRLVRLQDSSLSACTHFFSGWIQTRFRPPLQKAERAPKEAVFSLGISFWSESSLLFGFRICSSGGLPLFSGCRLKPKKKTKSENPFEGEIPRHSILMAGWAVSNPLLTATPYNCTTSSRGRGLSCVLQETMFV